LGRIAHTPGQRLSRPGNVATDQALFARRADDGQRIRGPKKGGKREITYVDLGPDVRPVRVLVDDHWRDGQLEAYRRDRDDTWRGFVRWSEGVGLTRIAWLDERCIRRADPPACTAADCGGHGKGPQAPPL
jgi:hypothetical protein